MRWALVLVVVIACSGKSKPPQNAGSGSQALYAKKVAVALAISGNDVFLQVTDETGRQTSYPLGTYQGECKVMTPKAEMNALTGVTCTGVELDVTTSGSDIIVLKGDGTDPMARAEVTRVTAPGGAAVVFGQ